MKPETAIDIIKFHLGLEPMLTVRGDEVKCCVPYLEDGGMCKAYFDEKALHELAEAFRALATSVSQPTDGEKP